MPLPGFGRSKRDSTSQGPHYNKRLRDQSQLRIGAIVRRYWKDYDGNWLHEDIEITRTGAFENKGTLWTAGRYMGETRQNYLSLADMGIIARGDGRFGISYTILLKRAPRR